MSELRFPWHTGRTVGVTLYKGDGPADMVGVMVGPHEEACALAQMVVEAVNERETLRAAVARQTAALERIHRLVQREYHLDGLALEVHEIADAALRGGEAD